MRLYLQGCGPLSCVDVHETGSLADLQAAVQVSAHTARGRGRVTVPGSGHQQRQASTPHVLNPASAELCIVQL